MRSFLQVLGGDFLCKVLWGVANLALVRCLPTDEFALLSLVTALFTVVFSGWFQNLYQLAVIGAQEAGLRQQRSAFLSLAFLPMPVVFAIAWPLLDCRVDLVLPWMVWTVGAGFVEFVRTQLRQRLQFGAYSLTELLKTITFVACVLPWLAGTWDGLTATQVLWFQAAATGMSLLVGGWERSWLTVSGSDAVRLIRELFRTEIRCVLGYFLLLAVFTRVDVFLLDRLGGPADVATYGAAFRLLGVLGMALNALHTIALPTLQQAQSTSAIQTVLRKQSLIGWAFQPLLAAVLLSAGWWFPLVDGGRYPAAINVFRILASGLSIGVLCSPYINVLFRLRDYQFLFNLMTGLTVASVPVIAALIPVAHATGAALGTTVLIAVLNVSIYLRSQRLLQTRIAVTLPEALSHAA